MVYKHFAFNDYTSIRYLYTSGHPSQLIRPDPFISRVCKVRNVVSTQLVRLRVFISFHTAYLSLATWLPLTRGHTLQHDTINTQYHEATDEIHLR